MSGVCEFNKGGKCIFNGACDFKCSGSLCSPVKYEALIQKLRSEVIGGENLYANTVLLPDNEIGIDNIPVDLNI